jgi:4-hydroxybenzoate polyprenyltransferase
MRWFFKTSRPRFWIYLLGPFAVGAAAAVNQPLELLAWPALLGLFFTYPANLFIYGVNDLYDFETDSGNDKKQGYEQVLDQSKHTKLIRTLALICLPWLALMPFLNGPTIISLSLFLILGWAYSAPPIRAKIHPGLDSLSNILYIMPGLAGYFAFNGQSLNWWPVTAAMLWAVAMHAYSAVPDIQADSKAGLRTIATSLGGYQTLVVCSLLYFLAAIFSYSSLTVYAIGFGMVYVSLMIISVIALKRGNLLKVYKMFPYVNSLIGAILFFIVLLK